jgi:SAM-dependent methyltransferase
VSDAKSEEHDAVAELGKQQSSHDGKRGTRGAYELLFPESELFGFPQHDHNFNFFTLLNQLLEPHFNVLDFGAGRGTYVDIAPDSLRQLKLIKGKVRNVVGADPSEAVLRNPYVDEAVVLNPDAPLPFPDASFDMIVSIAVFEHIQDPGGVCRELDRILKPGGLICAWTPNRWGYVALASRMIPDRMRDYFLREFAGIGGTGSRESEDVFPAFYRLNTRIAIGKHFPGYHDHSFVFNGPPAYSGGRMWLCRLIMLFEWLAPATFSRNLHIFLRKPT